MIHQTVRLGARVGGLIWLALLLVASTKPLLGQYSTGTNSNSSSHPTSFHVDDKFAGLTTAPDYPIDAGTGTHSINDFRPEPRDVFHLMDETADNNGMLRPLDFGTVANPVDQNNPAQQAIYGRNTWLLWCGGNEDFWDWLATDGYGVLDFLRMLDSRKRETRFRDLGLVNQPGLKRSTKPGPYGLYLDSVARMIGSEGSFNPLSDRSIITNEDGLISDGVDPYVYGYPSGVIGLRLFPNPAFKTNAAARAHWNADSFYNDPAYAKDPRTIRPFLVGMSCALCHVAAHPLNPPANPEEPEWSNLSSIIGNQYFRTATAFGANVDRGNFLWYYLASQQPGTIDTSMVTTDHINNANTMNAIFELPARLRRAALNLPEDLDFPAQSFPPEGQTARFIPHILMQGEDSVGVFGALARVYLNIGTYHNEWNRCSNPIIGFVPQKPFSIQACRRNSIYCRVNENFRVAYLAKFLAWENRHQVSGASQEQCATGAMRLKNARAPLDSIDIQNLSVGVLLTNGTAKTPTFAIGQNNGRWKVRYFDPAGKQTDASETADQSKYWTELKNAVRNEHGKLSDNAKNKAINALIAITGQTPRFIDLPANAQHWNETNALAGSRVFARNCMICHSSKQPDNFKIVFSHTPPAPATNWTQVSSDHDHLTLPYQWRDWDDFKKSAAYRTYVHSALALVRPETQESLRQFVDENFFSTDLRIPVSLTETPAGRALATNAKEKQVWSEYASKTYHNLPAVGEIHYYDPFEKTNKTFQPDAGGPGYYRPATLVSVWATAPLLHNNALGSYIPDSDETRRVSVEGRLAMFDDAIEKLLWKDKRGRSPSGEEGLRGKSDSPWCGADTGWIFRTDTDTVIRIPRGHLRHLVEGVLPGFVPAFIAPTVMWQLDNPWFVPLILAAISAVLIAWIRRAYFYFVCGTGVLLAGLVAVTGIHYLVPWAIWLVPAALIIASTLWLLTASRPTKRPRPGDQIEPRRRVLAAVCVALHAFFIVSVGVALWAGGQFVNGRLGDLAVGPIPKGVPVNSIMNLNPEAGLWKLAAAVRGLNHAVGRLRDDDAAPPALRMNDAQRLQVFEKLAGPALMAASKCPDFVLDRGHYFGESLTDDEKRQLISFLKTL